MEPPQPKLVLMSRLVITHMHQEGVMRLFWRAGQAHKQAWKWAETGEERGGWIWLLLWLGGRAGLRVPTKKWLIRVELSALAKKGSVWAFLLVGPEVGRKVKRQGWSLTAISSQNGARLRTPPRHRKGRTSLCSSPARNLPHLGLCETSVGELLYLQKQKI